MLVVVLGSYMAHQFNVVFTVKIQDTIYMARKLVPMSSAMESAVSSKSIPSILSLLEQGESIDVCQPATGVSLLMCVIREGLTDLACQLIERGSDIEARSAEGETALIEAAIVGNTGAGKVSSRSWS